MSRHGKENIMKKCSTVFLLSFVLCLFSQASFPYVVSGNFCGTLVDSWKSTKPSNSREQRYPHDLATKNLECFRKEFPKDCLDRNWNSVYGTNIWKSINSDFCSNEGFSKGFRNRICGTDM